MKISVVTPSFNQGEFIERTVQSVLTQQYPDFDYLVMDGGSTDQTVAVLKRYEQQLTWISEPDRGQAHAVNKAIHQTESDIIGWLNSDDVYYPNALKTVCEFFAAHPDVDVVYGEADFIDRKDGIIKPYPTEAWDLARFKSCCYISQPATFFRRRVVEKYGDLDEQLHFCMDYEYWLRLALHGAKFAYLPTILAGARVYAETKTSSGYVKANAEAVSMLAKHLGYVPAEWVVRDACGRVKAKGQAYSALRYLIAAWCELWRTTRTYQRGLARVQLWFEAQIAVARRLLRRWVIRFKIKS